MVRKTITRALQPLHSWLLRTVPLEDPWERFAYAVPLNIYGLGARREFRWYFEGECSVEVTSLDDMQEWLLQCDYVRDPDLFNEEDFWQHPRTFEELRKGDCEDFALWTWRQLVHLGYRAEFMVGQSVGCGRTPIGHSWVLFEHNNVPHLFDAVMRQRRCMVRPLEAARHEYVPEAAVDHRFNRYIYAGYYLRRRASQKDVSLRRTG